MSSCVSYTFDSASLCHAWHLCCTIQLHRGAAISYQNAFTSQWSTNGQHMERSASVGAFCCYLTSVWEFHTRHQLALKWIQGDSWCWAHAEGRSQGLNSNWNTAILNYSFERALVNCNTFIYLLCVCLWYFDSAFRMNSVVNGTLLH